MLAPALAKILAFGLLLPWASRRSPWDILSDPWGNRRNRLPQAWTSKVAC